MSLRKIKKNIMNVCSGCPWFKMCDSGLGLACEKVGGTEKPKIRGEENDTTRDTI